MFIVILIIYIEQLMLKSFTKLQIFCIHERSAINRRLLGDVSTKEYVILIQQIYISMLNCNQDYVSIIPSYYSHY